MLEKVTRSWELVKASASVLRSDKELMLFPVLSSISALVVLATFALPMMFFNVFDGRGFNAVGAAIAFLFYFCQYAVIIFFNAALVAAATIRLEGGDPTLGDGLRAARERLPAILGYAAIAATVGMLLQALKNKDNNFIVRMIGSGLGVAWTLATFLVVPVLVNRNVGPIDALKESIALFKRTWGENVIGNFTIGTVFAVVFIVAFIVFMVLGFAAYSITPALGLVVLVVAVLSMVMLGIVQAALGGIYSAALYRYATAHESPQAFAGFDLAGAFKPKG